MERKILPFRTGGRGFRFRGEDETFVFPEIPEERRVLISSLEEVVEGGGVFFLIDDENDRFNFGGAR